MSFESLPIGMTKRATAEVTLDAAPNQISNSLMPIMWSSRIGVTGQKTEENPLKITVYGEHSMSFRSWGEIVKIEITNYGNGSKVEAESKARISTTIFDYGQNKENLQVLLNQLILKFRLTSQLAIEEKTF